MSSLLKRNLELMRQRYLFWAGGYPIGQQAVAQLEIAKQLVSQFLWGHNLLFNIPAG
jgi:hypothetical protein